MQKARGLVFGLLIALTLSVGCTRVSPGYVGIRVVNGGSDRGVQDYPAQVGWVWYNPFTTSIFEYPTFVQTAIWTKSVGEGNPVNEEVSFTNKDKMLVSADVNLSYHLESAKVPAFYVKFRSDDLNHFTHNYLRNLARDIFNEHAGRYSIDQIMGDNALFLAEVRTSLQEQVRPLGVELDQFGIIGAPRPPQSVIDQINASVHAVQLTTQKQNELAQVEADAKKVVAQANGAAQSAVAAAEGEAQAITVVANAQAEANRKISATLTPTLVQYKALEKWNGQLPYLTGGGAVPFINVSAARPQEQK